MMSRGATRARRESCPQFDFSLLACVEVNASRATQPESAHRFYVREGYSLIKTSAVFSKQLTG